MSQSQPAASAEPGREAPRSPGVGGSPRWRQFRAGVRAAVVAVPLALLTGMWVGTGSSNTVVAAVPALLVVWGVPPLAVVSAQAWLSRRLGLSLRLGAAVAVALGVQALTLAGAVWMGVSAHKSGDVVLLTLVEAVVLPLVVTSLSLRERGGVRVPVP